MKQTRGPNVESARNPGTAQDPAPQARRETSAGLSALLAQSPRMVMQRQRLSAAFGPVVQRFPITSTKGDTQSTYEYVYGMDFKAHHITTGDLDKNAKSKAKARAKAERRSLSNTVITDDSFKEATFIQPDYSPPKPYHWELIGSGLAGKKVAVAYTPAKGQAPATASVRADATQEINSAAVNGYNDGLITHLEE
jgi:hypothetical protein